MRCLYVSTVLGLMNSFSPISGAEKPCATKRKHVVLALRELVEPLAFGRGGILLREILRQHPRGGGAHIHVAVRDGTDRVDQLAVRGALHQIAGRAGLHAMG